MFIGQLTGYPGLGWCNRLDAPDPVLWMDGLRPNCVSVHRRFDRSECHSPCDRHWEGARFGHGHEGEVH